MKKILLIILMCFYFTNVHASENFDTNENIKNEALEKENYNLKKVFGPYESLEKENDEFPYTDLDDFKYTEESEYLTIQPETKEGRIITEYEGNHYQKVKSITKARLSNQNNYGYTISIENISIKYKEEDISYDLEYVNADENSINAGGYIDFNFSKEYSLKDLKINILVNGICEKGTRVSFTMFSDDIGIYSIINRLTDCKLLLYLNYNESFVSPNGYDNYYALKDEIVDDMKLIGSIKLYTYKDILYHKYKLEKEYYNNYLTNEKIENNENKQKKYNSLNASPLISNQNMLFKNQQKFIEIQNPKVTLSNKLDRNSYKKINNKTIKNHALKNKTDKNFIKKTPLLILLLGIIILFLSKQYKKII